MTAGRTPRLVEGAHRDDLELVRAAAAGDESACRGLADRLLDRVRSTAFYLAGGRADADDYAQLAMVEILRSAGTYRGESSLEAWAERIAVRTAMRRIKRGRARPSLVSIDDVHEASPDPASDECLDRQRVSRRVARLLDTLKPKHRVAVTLKLLFGHTIAEIAELTDTHPDTVDYRLRTGRKLLRKKILNDPLLREWIGREGA
jgi:RNA polymerase sigma-70 factor (ECF subfamily)